MSTETIGLITWICYIGLLIINLYFAISLKRDERTFASYLFFGITIGYFILTISCFREWRQAQPDRQPMKRFSFERDTAGSYSDYIRMDSAGTPISDTVIFLDDHSEIPEKFH